MGLGITCYCKDIANMYNRNMRKTKQQIKILRENINKLIQEGHTFQEIADILGLKSHQLVQYHVKQFRKLSTENSCK